MHEAGIGLEEAYSKPLTEEVLRAADVVVTMGRSVGEVRIPEGARHLDWRLGYPAEPTSRRCDRSATRSRHACGGSATSSRRRTDKRAGAPAGVH